MLGAVNTRQTSQPFNVPPPVGGLNGRDPLASMNGMDAYRLDNAFPDTNAVTSRKGCVKHTNAALGVPSPVESLETYAGADGEVMLAWAGDKIYDVSTATPVQLATGLNTAQVVSAMFSNAADNAQHMILVNGIDTPKHFDGTTITNLTITGPTSANNLNFVFAFKEQLYFAENDKLGFWYLPTGQIQGAASYFDLAQVSKNGGRLLAIASFSEAGETPNDYIVFITTKGELIVYGGYDPSNANTFSLVGRYFTATPIGTKCAFNYSNELIILTLEGALPFSAIRMGGDSKARGVADSERAAITSKLGRFLLDYTVNSTTEGWQTIHYPRGGWLLVNVPTTATLAGDYYHYVMNTATNSWCRFTNWNGICFTVFNNRLYFGRYDGYVMLADEGRVDDDGTVTDANILVDIKQAYNYFSDDRGSGPVVKHFQWASLIVGCDGTPPLSGKFNVNFKEDQPSYLNTLAETSGSAWDTTDWDVGEWGFSEDVQRFIITLNKGGFVGSLWLRASLDGLMLNWYSTQFVFEDTRNLLI